MLLMARTRRGSSRDDITTARHTCRRRARPTGSCREVLSGVVAGAVGTTALAVATYLDMATRPRPASTTPEQTVRRIEELVHVTLSSHGADSDEAAARPAGFGGLLGIAAGWTASSWASDVAPHLAYGIATAEAWRMLNPSRPGVSTVGSGANRDG